MSTNARQPTSDTMHNGVLEVSDLRTTRVQEYAQEASDVYFERKGGRTFLVSR